MPTDDEMLDFLSSNTRRLAHIAPELWVEDPGVFRVKTVGLFHIDVAAFMYTAAIVLTPTRGSQMGYVDRWCYETIPDALEAAKEWSGTWPLSEPEGWHRHPATGRRRAGGDPEQERVEM